VKKARKKSLQLQVKLEQINLVLCQFRIGQGKKSLEKIPFGLSIELLIEDSEKSESQKLENSKKKKNEGTKLGVILSLKVGDPSSEKPSEYPVDLEVAYMGVFLINCENFLEEEIKKIGAINCAAIIFPFVREEVANLVLKSINQPFLLRR